MKSVPLGIRRAASSGRVLGTRPGVCFRCTHVSVSKTGSWLVHGAPWWPWQDRGQKEPCSCACLQLHSSLGVIFGFLGRVERRGGGWCWLVLLGPSSAMWSNATGQQLHVPRSHFLQMLVGSRSSRSCAWCVVVCSCGWLCVYPYLCSGASSSISCTSIMMVGRRRCRLSLWGFWSSHRRPCRQSYCHVILRCQKLRGCFG